MKYAAPVVAEQLAVGERARERTERRERAMFGEHETGVDPLSQRESEQLHGTRILVDPPHQRAARRGLHAIGRNVAYAVAFVLPHDRVVGQDDDRFRYGRITPLQPGDAAIPAGELAQRVVAAQAIDAAADLDLAFSDQRVVDDGAAQDRAREHTMQRRDQELERRLLVLLAELEEHEIDLTHHARTRVALDIF